MNKNNTKNICKKFKKININEIKSIEKWILDDCYCNICNNDTYINDMLRSIKIKKENNFQLEELTLTSKMIIKIQTEIVKKHLLETIFTV
jgi:hypothetical protein